MAKTRQQKQEAVDIISQNLQSAKSAVFANFQGLKMEDIDELRGICKDQDVYYAASKKTLVKIALQNAGYDIDTKEFEEELRNRMMEKFQDTKLEKVIFQINRALLEELL